MHEHTSCNQLTVREREREKRKRERPTTNNKLIATQSLHQAPRHPKPHGYNTPKPHGYNITFKVCYVCYFASATDYIDHSAAKLGDIAARVLHNPSETLYNRIWCWGTNPQNQRETSHNACFGRSVFYPC